MKKKVRKTQKEKNILLLDFTVLKKKGLTKKKMKGEKRAP